MISQYLIQDANLWATWSSIATYWKVSQSIIRRLGTNLLHTLKAYEGQRNLFSSKSSTTYIGIALKPHIAAFRCTHAYDRLIQIRNDLVHKSTPNNEIGWQTLGEDVVQDLREVRLTCIHSKLRPHSHPRTVKTNLLVWFSKVSRLLRSTYSNLKMKPRSTVLSGKKDRNYYAYTADHLMEGQLVSDAMSHPQAMWPFTTHSPNKSNLFSTCCMK